MKNTMKNNLLALLPCLFLISCDSNTESPSQALSLSTKGTSPEKVVKQWQSYMDKNRLEQAKTIGTERTILFLEDIQTFFKNQEIDSLTTKSEFRRLKCDSKGEKATCYTSIKDLQYDEIYNDTFYLKKQKGKWLIDLKED